MVAKIHRIFGAAMKWSVVGTAVPPTMGAMIFEQDGAVINLTLMREN